VRSDKDPEIIGRNREIRKMKLKEIIRKREKGVSFEFFPPKNSEGREGFMKVVHKLKGYNPMYASVTYGAGGSTQERTGNTLKWIKEETDLTVMSHLTCIGSTRDGIDTILKDYMANNIDNILALRGDLPKNVPDFDLTRGEFVYAKDLVELVADYHYFSIAVAVYPEGHFESPSIEKDMEFTKMKIDAGADFGITQMFFDNRYYFDFMDRAQKIGITVPILPGIMPITDCGKIEEFASFCNATIPQEIKKKMEPFLNRPEEMEKVGIEYAIRQCEDLIKNGVKYLHLYTMNKSGPSSSILDSLSI
jgi:methylenetetrahydrofolate reductase (NADPH)